MRFLVDENIPKLTVKELRTAGHDVIDVRGTDKQGSDDVDLWALAQKDARTVITTDRGFTHHRDSRHFGLIVVAVRQPNLARIHERVLWAVEQMISDGSSDRTIVMRDMVRSDYFAQTPEEEP